MDEIIQEFLTESWENLAQLDQDIVELEKHSDDPELLGSIFRAIHTIKGTCGFLGLEKLRNLAHSTENVLGQLRSGKLEITRDAVSLTLQAIDEIKDLLTAIEESGGQESQVDHGPLIQQLDTLAGETFVADSSNLLPELPGPQAPGVEAFFQQATVPGNVATEPSGSPMAPDNGPVDVTTLRPAGIRSVSGLPPHASRADDPSATADKPAPRPIHDLSIRVNVDVLDTLMNLVGELVLTRNQLLQLSRGDEESRYTIPISHLNRVTTDLQEGVMKTRMQPIGNAWSKLPRVVRDLSQVTGKMIELEMHGSETELDRTVLDAIKDPLTHMIRNSADHGIEAPEVRVAAGKPQTGTLRLDAYHEGGHVIIRIEDDGAGLNIPRIKAKAVANGLVSESVAETLNTHELAQFIFHPGFSTAEKVTSVSGRGVGMDVVKTQIDKIGGTVDVLTDPGRRTTVRIKIPLTLAIISALVVEAGGESFAIPQLGVVELVRLATEDQKRIEHIHHHQVYRLRDRLLPLVRLSNILGLEDTGRDTDADVNIVVVQIGEEQLGLIVNEVFDTEEIVVKPVGSLLKDVALYQGTTILGDGRVIIILDVAGIAAEVGNLAGIRNAAESREADLDPAGELTSLLLFSAGNGKTMSVPLSLVSRLEEIAADRIEQTDEHEVVQYRGDLLPLLPVINAPPRRERAVQPVIVFSENHRSMGLLVDEIEDIIEEELVIRMQSNRPGIVGTAIINGKATDILDAHHYVLKANPHWFENNQISHDIHILLAEDSIFFRQLAQTSLETQGYHVIAVDNGEKATQYLERGERVDLLISDIEMPVMGGLDLARWVRERDRLNGLQMVAMSGNTSPSLSALAMDAGFNHFLRKFDPAELNALVAKLTASAARIKGVSA